MFTVKRCIELNTPYEVFISISLGEPGVDFHHSFGNKGEGWLKSATIELSQFHLSKQSTDDYVFTNEVLVPTNTCKTICSIFKSRKNSLKTLLQQLQPTKRGLQERL